MMVLSEGCFKSARWLVYDKRLVTESLCGTSCSEMLSFYGTLRIFSIFLRVLWWKLSSLVSTASHNRTTKGIFWTNRMISGGIVTNHNLSSKIILPLEGEVIWIRKSFVLQILTSRRLKKLSKPVLYSQLFVDLAEITVTPRTTKTHPPKDLRKPRNSPTMMMRTAPMAD